MDDKPHTHYRRSPMHLPGRMKAEAKVEPWPKRKRVQFHEAGGVIVSIWADYAEEHGVYRLKLLHVYPDFTPVVGLAVTVDGESYEVRAVEADGSLVCVPHA